MSVAAPVLERKVAAEEEQQQSYFTPQMTSDQIHNARIKQIYAKLMDPEADLNDFRAEKMQETVQEPVAVVAPVAQPEVAPVQPYLVQGARADADIFRADSPINMKAETAQISQIEDEEEENEDLRPTPTTIQYRTAGLKTSVEEGKIENTSAEKRSGLSKKEKIVIAVVVGVVLALLALIIINSTIISGLNGDLNSLQSTLSDVKTAANNVNNQISDYIEREAEIVQQYVSGMVPRI